MARGEAREREVRRTRRGLEGRKPKGRIGGLLSAGLDPNWKGWRRTSHLS